MAISYCGPDVSPDANMLSGPGGEVALSFLANPLSFLEDVSNKFGPLVSLRLAGERVVLVADSKAAEKLLITENASLAKVCAFQLWILAHTSTARSPKPRSQ